MKNKLLDGLCQDAYTLSHFSHWSLDRNEIIHVIDGH